MDLTGCVRAMFTCAYLCSQPLTLPEYKKMDVSQLPLKEQRRYWKLLNRQVIKEKNAEKQKL